MSQVLSHKKIFVIIPAYNEKAVISTVVKAVTGEGYTVVLVDDGSKEDMRAELESDQGLIYLRHAANLGQGAALQTGIEFALREGADFLVTFDADGQHLATDIARLVACLQNDEADIVLASRFLAQGHHNATTTRKLLLKAARWIDYLFTGIYLSDAHNGLRAMNRRAASSIIITENRMAHATEIIARIKKQGLRYKEVAATVVYTPYSKQKGQRGIHSVKIFFDLVLHKLFR